VSAAAWSGPLTGAAFVAGVAGGLRQSELPYPRPGSSAAEIRRYFAQRRPPRISAAGQLISAAALGRFAAAVAERAGRKARPGPFARRGPAGEAGALHALTLGGGALAVGSLAASAGKTMGLARGAGRDDAGTLAMHRRAFLAGGPIHGVGFGAVLAALGLTGRRTGALPDALSTAALVTAVPNVLSPLYLLAEPAGWLIPIGRFSGYVVLAAAGPRL
jgi:hypothetical protein